MEFEDLQAIWDTQNEKPVFAMQDARLLVALYQQRERSRRRLFKRQFAPMYLAALLILAVLGVLFVTFVSKSRFPRHGFPMSAWDYAGFAVAAGASLAIVVPMYLERKKHERTQEIFAPTLREELDRGIAQLDFTMRLDRPLRVIRMLTLLAIIAVIACWEEGRLAGDPTPWWLAVFALFCAFLGGRAGFAARKKVMGRVLARRRALESMRASLDEDAAVPPPK